MSDPHSHLSPDDENVIFGVKSKTEKSKIDEGVAYLRNILFANLMLLKTRKAMLRDLIASGLSEDQALEELAKESNDSIDVKSNIQEYVRRQELNGVTLAQEREILDNFIAGFKYLNGEEARMRDEMLNELSKLLLQE